ncbi:DNA-3-methyladenine glycosylase [Clostridium cavendishii DSM 21758]|uniref:Putative 3-methyladenine DNA glycosylase n=1 Tax=Clostridium cavendishii DSM 21758 TaxID=1121302 RepID=A0A1M6PLL5_9CLOT|nr:DNA-3-methyladenine glycosylase [Clostridium cavendishii]SHK08864.1 DNA-3-methyladenine glycosylase [Clostridium cavendishii DSM 21758]
MKVSREFFSRDTLVVAKELLGKILVREFDGKIIKGRIVETEAYIGPIDKACHAYGLKKTPKVEPLYGEPGIAYVYSIYGMYYCFNIITKEKGSPEGVLIRAIEPLEGLNIISENRFKDSYENITKAQKKNLANGPGKLCIAFNINKQNNWEDLIISDSLYVEESQKSYNEKFCDFDIVETTRIGIDYAEEARYFPWRFYIKDNNFISKK